MKRGLADRIKKSVTCRLLALAAMAGLLSSCGLSLSLVPTAGDPNQSELEVWQYRKLLEAPLEAIPEEMRGHVPDRYQSEAAQFVTRTLETAPDGAIRRWHSADRSANLTIQLVSTEAKQRTVCRNAIFTLTDAAKRTGHEMRLCRRMNGTWAEPM